jgi:cytochrome c oxidase subunit 3
MQYMNRQTLTKEEKAERERERQEREAALRLRNNRLGIAIFQGSWVMVFVALIWVNTQMRFSPDWVAEGVQLPSATLPTVATVALLLSAWLTRAGLQAVHQSNKHGFLMRWQGAIGLGVVFFAIMMLQFFSITQGMGQFVSVYRLMIGYHALHAVVIGIMMVQVYRYGQAGKYHADNFWSVEAAAKLWYFVVVAWIMFYVVLYLV